MLEHQNEFKVVFCRCSEPYWNDMYRFALSLARIPEQAEEIVQESLLRGCKYFERFATGHLQVFSPKQAEQALSQVPGMAKRFKGWILRIVKNVFVDMYSARHEQLLMDQGDPEDDVTERGGPWSTHDNLLTCAENDMERSMAVSLESFYDLAADEQVYQAVMELSDRQQALVYLYCEDFSYKEIAAILDIPIGSVMSGLSRSLGRIRGQLTAQPTVRTGTRGIKPGRATVPLVTPS